MKAIKWSVIFASIALGVATTLVVFLVLIFALGASRAVDVVFGYSPAIFVVPFGALWYPFVRRRLR